MRPGTYIPHLQGVQDDVFSQAICGFGEIAVLTMNIICVGIGMVTYLSFAWIDRKEMIQGVLKRVLAKFANMRMCNMCCRKGIGQWLRANDEGVKWAENPLEGNKEKVLELREHSTTGRRRNEDGVGKMEIKVEVDEIVKLREELGRKERVIQEKDKQIASNNETVRKLKAMLNKSGGKSVKKNTK